MKKRFFQIILILPVLVLLCNALVPGVASGQEDSIVVSKTTVVNCEAGPEGGEFGSAVAVDGSSLAVGAILADGGADNSGAAYLSRITDIVNCPQSKLFENGDAKSTDHFGYSLALSGNALVIGANWMDNGDLTDTGAAFVARFSYDETKGEWTFPDEDRKRLIPTPSSAPRDEFGYSVAVSGDTAVVGTYRAEAVYVFEYNGSDWDQKARLTGDPNGGEKFGISVAIDGDTLAVGASKGYYGDVQTGSVYVFTRNGSTWDQQTELFAEDLAYNDQFGYSVALDGDTLVVGAPRHDDVMLDSGAAYVFRRNGDTWNPNPEAKLAGSKLFEKAYFGSSVALSGNTVVVGAPKNDVEVVGVSGTDLQVEASAPLDAAGSAYVFRLDGSKWDQKQILTLDNPGGQEEFGCAVAISGDVVAVGAHKDGNLSGSAYVYTLAPENHPPVADAGENQEVEEGSPVTLDGSDSYDLDLDGLTYSWTQTGGPDVELDTADPAKPTFTAPACQGENLTLSFKLVVNDGNADCSEPAVVEVTVLPGTNSITEINSVLGSEHRSWGIDKDMYTFQGTQGKQVTVTLRANSAGRNNGGERATLKLKDNIRGVAFYRVDSGRLPNQISATLPATGEYQVIVAGQPRLFRGKRFLGEYTLTVEGASGSVEKGAGPSAVHKNAGSSAKSHKEHPIWNWIMSRIRH